MRVRVLGASGSDLPGHHLTSFLLNDNILFDAGGVTNSLRIEEQLKIKEVFITHAHLDHIRDIPFLADNFILSNTSHEIRVLSIKEVIDDIKRHLLNQKLWPDFTVIPNEANSIVKLITIKEKQPILVDSYTITAYKVNHTVPAVGYLIQKDNKSIFYTGDTGPTENTWKNISQIRLDALIIEVSFPNKMSNIAKLTGHLTPKLLIDELKIFQYIPKRLYITHLKSVFRKEIEKELEKLNIVPLSILRGEEIIEI